MEYLNKFVVLFVNYLYMMEVFQDFLKDDPLLYFDLNFLNQNQAYWTPELFDFKNKNLVDRIALFYYDYVKVQYIYNLFLILKEKKLNMNIVSYLCRDFKMIKITHELGFEEFYANFIPPLPWEIEKQNEIQEMVMNHLFRIYHYIINSRQHIPSYFTIK
jgi:hypothetical protein